MNDKITKLQEMIDSSENIVFFGGAGVSTESGIPDFRSVDGLYNQKYKYPPEEIISHSFFEENPEEFYRFRRIRRSFTGSTGTSSSSAAQSRTPPISISQSLRRRERSRLSSLRISTGCTRRRARRTCSSSTARSFAITALNAASATPATSARGRRECRYATAGA